MTSPAATAQLVYNLPSSAFNEPAYKSASSGGVLLGPEGPVDADSELPRKGSDELMESLKELDTAQAAYRTAQMFYNGEAGDLHTNPRIAELLARAGAAEIEDFQYAAVPVDSVADNLLVRAVTVASGAEADDQERKIGAVPQVDQVAQRAQEAVDELRKTNELDAEELVLHLEASKGGDAYLFVWPQVEPAGESDEDPVDELDLHDGQYPQQVTGVDMWVNTADTVRAFYDTENPLRMTHVIKAWQWSGGRQRATLYYPDRIERWVSDPNQDKAKPEAWKPYLAEQGDEWPLENPTGRIPFFHFRNRRPYGLPEHVRAYGPQRLINKLITAHMGTVDYQSYPQRYLLLSEKAEDALLNLVDPDYPEDDQDDPEGDGRSQYRADPSAVWKIPGGVGAGQFPAADPSVFIEPLDRYIKSMAELTKTPLDEFVGMAGAALSGEARRMGRKPLTDKLRNRSKAYGATWQDAYEFALGLLGFGDVTVNVEWAPFETASGMEDWNTIGVKIAQGVPVSQALQEAGYERDMVEGWLTDETGADLTRRVALLNSIGTAVQTIGAGVGLGVIAAPQAAEIFARILGLSAEGIPELDQPVEVAQPAPTPPPGFGPPAGGDEGGDQQGAPPAPPPMPPPPPPIVVGQGGPAPSRE